MYGARIWAWKASRAARPGRDGEGARLAARVTFWVSFIVRTQQHGREKTGGTGERILYAHISKYPSSPQEEEEKRQEGTTRRRCARELEQDLHIALDLPRGRGSTRSPDGTGAARWACLAVKHSDTITHSTHRADRVHRTARKQLPPARAG
ncbi:hypothetical protein B0H14DRAFT_3873821 [Mycena olivaceomarginata]|nr:hypothetical protein B0H14DRAFT_3873821 [Mycena olivaceomarginata]